MFDKTALELRERSGFEALDSGLFLYRKHFRTIQAGIVPFYLPFVVGIGFVPRSYLWIPAAVLWLLTPLLGRLALRPLAHTFFLLPGTARWKGSFRGALGDVSWRRFSPWRHYVLPVRVLEGLRGAKLRKRIAHIRGEGLGVAFALNAVMFLGTLMLTTGLAMFVVAMQNFMPHAFRRELSFETPGAWHAVLIAYAVLVGLFEPAAASMGFGLYINRRVSLEGWDLEIAFARWSRRLAAGGRGLILVLLLFFAPMKAEAAKNARESFPSESLETVLSGEDFGAERERTGFRLKESPEERGSIWDDLFGSAGRDRPSFAAAALRILVVALAAAAALYVAWRNRDLLAAAFRRRAPAPDGTAAVPAETGGPAPAYDREQARRLLEEGLVREAWAMAYAGAVEAAGQNIEAAPGPEATEGEWIRFLRSAVPEQDWAALHEEGLTALIEHWRALAYAHRNPGPEAFGEALSALDVCVGISGAARPGRGGSGR